MFKKIIGSIAAITIAISTIEAIPTVAAEPEIEQNENSFLIHVDAETQWRDIYYTYPRYSFNLYVDGEQIDTKNQNLVIQCGIGLNYGDFAKISIVNWDAVAFDIELVPTGKFIENTEVLIGDSYFLMAETEINNCPVYGDMNRNNKIDVGDLVLLQRYLLGYKMENPIIPWRGDVIRDGTVDVFDMIGMRQLLIEKGGLE